MPSIDGVVVSKNEFAGWYAGIQGGGQFANLNIAGEFDGIGADGLVGGAHVGYNLAFGDIVTGPYAEGSLSNVDVKLGNIDLLTQDWYIQGGWLAGITVTPKTLLSIHAGYELASWTSDLGPGDADVYSWVIGGGIQTKISKTMSFGIKADYIMPSEIKVNGDDYSTLLDASEELRVMGRLTWHPTR